MATRARAREIFDRSRVLLDRSRVVAAHLLDPPRHPVPKAIEAGPSSWAEAARTESLVDVCASIALRDLNLIDMLLAELEEMSAATDPFELLTRQWDPSRNGWSWVGRGSGRGAGIRSRAGSRPRRGFRRIPHLRVPCRRRCRRGRGHQ
jgi:hypothetical protein